VNASEGESIVSTQYKTEIEANLGGKFYVRN